MKILAFTDPHGSMKAFKAIKKKSAKSDLILCCGDLTVFEMDLHKHLSLINKFGKKILIIPGNHESNKNLAKACQKYKNIIYADNMAYETEDLLILAVEGNGFSIEDKQFERISKKFMKKLKGNKKKYILMTHAPPWNTKLDILYDGCHCGNKAIRRFIKKTKPIIALSGHLHENNGKKDKLGKTVLINPGPEGIFLSV